jgi:hypothetical protein
MAKKLLLLNMVINHKVNADLLNFVNKDQAKIFSLCNSPFEDH